MGPVAPAAAAPLLLLGIALAAAPASTPDPLPAPERMPGLLWSLIGTGVLLCIVAAYGVWAHYPSVPLHAVWSAGLVFLACAAWTANVTTVSPRPGGSVAMATALALAALGLYTWRLAEIPYEIHGDDAEVGMDALRLLADPFHLFHTSWFRLPILHALPTAPFVGALGPSAIALRLPTALLGAATVVLVYLTGRRLWGTAAGLLAAVLLAANPFFLHLSRTGFHYIHTPFLSILVFWLLLRGWQDGRPGAWIACGLALGLGIQSYYASRLVPLLLAATWLLAWIFAGGAERKRLALAFALLVLAATAAAAPMIAHFARHPDDLWYRVQGVSLFAERGFAHASGGYRTDSLAVILAHQFARAAGLFHAIGDTSLQYGARAPLLDPITGAAFALGLGAVLRRPGDAWRFSLALWVIAPVLLGVALTVDAPFFPRASGVVPFAALLAAAGLLGAARLVTGARRRFAPASMAALLAAAAAAGNVSFYLFDYAPGHRLSAARPIGEWAAAHARGSRLVLINGNHRLFVAHGTLRYLTHGIPRADAPDVEQALRIARASRRPAAFAILPPVEPARTRLRQALGPLHTWRYVDERGRDVFAGVIPASDGGAGSETRKSAWPASAPAALRRGLDAMRAASLAGVLVVAALARWAFR